MSLRIHFKVAIPDDSARIARLVQVAFNHVDVKWTGPDITLNRNFSMTSEEVLAIISNPNAVFLMAATGDGTPVGAVAAIKRTEKLARFALLVVDPAFQAIGIGRRVLEQAEKYALSMWNAKILGLNALNTRGLLIKWYEKRGYAKTGEKSELPAKVMGGLALAKDVHFVEMEKHIKDVHVDGIEQPESRNFFETIVVVRC